jgi:hypothetical protein
LKIHKMLLTLALNPDKWKPALIFQSDILLREYMCR